MKYYKKIIILLSLFAVFNCASNKKKTVLSKSEHQHIVVAYHNGRTIDVSLVTHVIFSFGHVNRQTFDKISINENALRELAKYKEAKPSLKVLAAIGGWGSGGFSEMARDETLRLSFAADCKRLIDETGIDGIDLDWEYPTSSAASIVSSPEDKDNFTLLCRDIRAAIGTEKLLTFASAANANYVDFKAVMPYIDFVNLMTYDMDSPPYHHSALFPSEHTRFSCQESVQAHFDAGVPYNKMTLGMPFYGRTDRSLQTGDNAAIHRDIIGENWLKNPARFRKWDDKAKVPYIVDDAGKIICVYDDAQSIAIKCAWIRQMGLLGAMYWHYSHDDENNTLRKAVYDGMMK
jgi:chitinase